MRSIQELKVKQTQVDKETVSGYNLKSGYRYTDQKMGRLKDRQSDPDPVPLGSPAEPVSQPDRQTQSLSLLY